MFRLNPLAVGYFALIYSQRESAIRIGTGPGFKHHRSTILPIVGQRDENPVVTLLAFRQVHLHSSFSNTNSNYRLIVKSLVDKNLEINKVLSRARS
jgi:hypothetical protein